jgi:hypothetical protein
MIRTFWKETGLDDKEEVSWIEEKIFQSQNFSGLSQFCANLSILTRLCKPESFGDRSWEELDRASQTTIEGLKSKMTASSRGSRAAASLISEFKLKFRGIIAN